MRETFQCEVGLSDHTSGIGAAIASIALDAVLVEKHFNLHQEDESLDAAFSLGAAQMKQLVVECLAAWQAKGRVVYGASGDEEKSLQFRRSLFFTKDLKKGDIISIENIKSIRPGFGLSPKHLSSILGRQVSHDIKRGTPVHWDSIGGMAERVTLNITETMAEL